MDYLKIDRPFVLENGAILPDLTIAYTTYGRLSEKQDNVIWICHALTANSEPHDWWSGLVGEGRLFDPESYYIVCANMLGSCYGSSGPQSTDPATGHSYGRSFPQVTIRDMVKCHRILQGHLGIERILLGMGGSMGGQQVLEWAIADPSIFECICLIATNAQHSPWGIAFNEAQRMALKADPTFASEDPDGGAAGLEAARAIGMLSYRSYATYRNTQQDETNEKLDDFRASSYQRYQGVKLRKRFHAYAYYILSKAMDSHNVGRGRASIGKALQKITAKTAVIGIETDILFPVQEQRFLAEHIPDAFLEIIESPYGHDGFLVEYDKIAGVIKTFIEGGTLKKVDDHLSGGLPFDDENLPGSESF